MIIQRVKFENFGIYSGEQTIELGLSSDSMYDCPIILLHGKNGVGKTSFVEAIRIALHGSLALGDRVSQRAYHEHLKRRIHRPANLNAHRPTSAMVSVTFDLVRESKTYKYDIIRSWHLSGSGLTEQLEVLENGQVPLNVSPENFEPFLRDLVPASQSDLFFFDGERIDSFAEDESVELTLADAMQRLLGLNLVHQLEADLDVYISRTAGQMGQQELQTLQEENESLETAVADLKIEHIDLEQQIRDGYAAIARQEQELADKGGIYAKEYPRLQKNKIKLRQEVDILRRRMQDSASGLLPIAAAPKIAGLLLQRLDLEAKQQQQDIISLIIEDKRNELIEVITSSTSAPSVNFLTKGQKDDLISLINGVLGTNNQALISEKEVFIQVSERDRSSMSVQIKEALEEVSVSFHDMAKKLATLEAELEKTEFELRMAPSDIIIQPIFDVIQLLDKQVKQLENDQKRVVENLAVASFKLEQSNSKIKRAKESLKESQRVDLALRAQRAIRSYALRLKTKKLQAFQNSLINRFNSLCRKDTFLSSVFVDPDTFAITIERNGEHFRRSMLSAGEKQLFALSILWALREVAGVPIPVIIDTPLSRLDSDHRSALLKKFFPEVAHQVILLATDTEINEAVIKDLAPYISHSFKMVFNPETGNTCIEPLSILTLVGPPDELVNNNEAKSNKI